MEVWGRLQSACVPATANTHWRGSYDTMTHTFVFMNDTNTATHSSMLICAMALNTSSMTALTAVILCRSG